MLEPSNEASLLAPGARGAAPAGIEHFRPPWGLGAGHVQSILAGWPLRGRGIRARARRLLALARPEILQCADGARLLGYYSPQPIRSRGLVILLHGWEGCAHSHYILSSATVLHEAGFEVFRLNFRDHGDTHALNEGLFHSCRIGEVVDAVRLIQARRPGRVTFLVGYSLGGNFAIRVASRAAAAGIALEKAVAVCPVLRPHSTMEALERGLWIYRRYFLDRWRRSLAAKRALFPHLYDFGDLRKLPTLTATTEFFVRRYTEFKDLDEYLDGYAITGNVLASLSVPTTLIAAANDPIIPMADLADLHPSPALTVTVLRNGGHCGFIEDYGLRSWMDRRVLAELEGAT